MVPQGRRPPLRLPGRRRVQHGAGGAAGGGRAHGPPLRRHGGLEQPRRESQVDAVQRGQRTPGIYPWELGEDDI